jgi:hypothetical protein
MVEFRMEPLGIMLYGYSESDSKIIKNSIESTIQDNIILISGAKKEDMKVIEILEKGPDDIYEDVKNKILMFLGFNSEQVDQVISDFPKEGGLKRPIFAGLTEQNIDWTLNYLIEHLLEEERYWSSKQK